MAGVHYNCDSLRIRNNWELRTIALIDLLTFDYYGSCLSFECMRVTIILKYYRGIFVQCSARLFLNVSVRVL